MKIIIFAGTTEGRRMAMELAEAGHFVVCSVATMYGAEIMEDSILSDNSSSTNIRVVTGRMDKNEMLSFLQSEGFEVIIDATHPFAEVVSENIRECERELSKAGCKVRYMRLIRETASCPKDDKAFSQKENTVIDCSTVSEAVEILKTIEGNILITTGSKNLHDFAASKELGERLFVRVLPGLESISLCLENGIKGRNIIAMQGPFSKEMNAATIKEYGISVLVTKESGKNGGFYEKLEAAAELGIKCVVIRKPEEKTDKVYSFEEILSELGVKTSQSDSKLYKATEIAIAGVGMGDKANMTIEVKELIDKADIVFGAERLLDKAKGVTYPYYLAKDIIPVIKEAEIRAASTLRVVILMSGDTGFYSGCMKLRRALLDETDATVKVYPGISSISYLAARLGMSYQEAEIISTHGIDKGKWLPELNYSVLKNEKTFFITSGPEDLNEIGKLINNSFAVKKDVKLKVILGYMLSYENEIIREYSAEELTEISEKGLYAGVIINSEPEKVIRSSRITDSEFERGRVPMTKEEVRDISIAKLMLYDGAVLYDIGSGTGSVSVAAASLSPKIKVYALERNEEAVELTRKNKEKFGLTNIEIIEAYAPIGLDSLVAPTHVFIGGSGGKLKEIVEAVRAKNSKARFVINAISIETVCEIKELLAELQIEDADIVQLSVSRAKTVGNYHLMEANNPVYIVSF